MVEFVKAFFANASERIKNPLIGTFLMSWIVFNWKGILILLFSTNDIETKLTILSDKYYNLGNFIICPLMVALAYIFILPYINLGIDKILSDSNSKHHEKIQGNRILVIKDNTAIAIANIELEEAQAEYRDRAKQNVKIKNLETTIQSLENELNNEKEKLNVENEIAIEEKNKLQEEYSRLKDELLKYETLILNIYDENIEMRKDMINNEQLIDLVDNPFVGSLVKYINNLHQALKNDLDKNILHVSSRLVPATPRNSKRGKN